MIEGSRMRLDRKLSSELRGYLRKNKISMELFCEECGYVSSFCITDDMLDVYRAVRSRSHVRPVIIGRILRFMEQRGLI